MIERTYVNSDLSITREIIVKNIKAVSQDLKNFHIWGTKMSISLDELKKLDKEKNTVYLNGKMVKLKSTSNVTIVPHYIIYKNITIVASPSKDNVSVFQVDFLPENGELDLDFVYEKVKELYPDFVADTPNKPLEFLDLREGFHGTYAVKKLKKDIKAIITPRGIIIHRNIEQPKEIQKYIDYILGLRDADEEITKILINSGRTEIYADTAGAVGPAFISFWKNSVNATIYCYDRDTYTIEIDGNSNTSVHLPGGQKGITVNTEKKKAFIDNITITKENITAKVPYLDGYWEIIVPWNYNGPNPFTAELASELPPEIKKRPMIRLPKAKSCASKNYFVITFHYDTGYLEYDGESDTIIFKNPDDGTEIELSRDVLEVAETIEEAVELQKFLQ